MTTHRSWFPFILVGLSAALLAVILVAYRPNDAHVDSDLPVVVAPTGDEYKAAVHDIMITQTASSGAGEISAQTAYDALLALHVPAEYKDVHIQLVLAYGEMASGQIDLGRARLVATETANPWLLQF